MSQLKSLGGPTVYPATFQILEEARVKVLEEGLRRFKIQLQNALEPFENLLETYRGSRMKPIPDPPQPGFGKDESLSIEIMAPDTMELDEMPRFETRRSMDVMA